MFLTEDFADLWKDGASSIENGDRKLLRFFKKHHMGVFFSEKNEKPLESISLLLAREAVKREWEAKWLQGLAA